MDDKSNNKKEIVSPSRRYVAMCNNTNWDGHYFKSFTIPKEHKNNTEYASWYFLNRLDSYACIERCVTEEDFRDITEAKNQPGE